MKAPKFAQQILSKNKVDAERLQDKIKGQNTIYMGDPSLHWGVGGWIRGRANLVYGPFGSGKSTLALKGAGEEQKLTNGYIIIFDSEYNHKDPHEVDNEGNLTEDAIAGRSRYEKAGINWEKVLLIKSNEMDNLFGPLNQIKEDLKDDPGLVSAIIVDSWGGVQSEGSKKKIGEGDVANAGNSFGGNAKAMGPVLQELLRVAAENAVTMFFVQHCMKNMDMYGPEYILIGGERLKFLVHSIIFLESVRAKDAALLGEGDVKIGKRIRFWCEKSRTVVEGRRGEFWMDFSEIKFAKAEESLFGLASQLGIIAHPKTFEVNEDGTPKLDKDGKQVVKENKIWWEYPAGAATPLKYKGQANLVEALTQDKNLYIQVYNDCMKSKKLDAETEEVKAERVGGKKSGKK